MTDGTAPTRQKDSLADVVEMLLDKGVVINADIAVSVGETELLGIKLRAAIASFETAAQYGLEFPDGTDMERVEAASNRRDLRKPPERGLSTQVGVTDPEEPAEGATETADEGTEAADEAETTEDGDEQADASTTEVNTEADGTADDDD
jgi:hypothetical protein